MLKTKEELEKIGVSITIDNSYNCKVDDFDIVHIFNTLSMPSSYYQLLNAKRSNKPVALSTIYWNMQDFNYSIHNFKLLYKNDLNKLFKKVFKREIISRKDFEKVVINRFQQETVILASNCLLPNSEAEMQQIRDTFNSNNEYFVVCNGVDENITKGNAEEFRKKYNIDYDFVITAGFISPRKNQLRVIEACNKLGLRYVMIGGCSQENSEYLEKCKKVGKSNLCYLGRLEYNDIRNAYSACRIHALASSVETPGLATLEAGACCKNLVVCDRGSVKEYIKEFGYYCDYYDVESIAKAIRKAWNEPVNIELSKQILNNYTWKEAARQTLSAYNSILSK
jgi:glycosyltransferase involved in cell wall biosynthesis